MVSGSLLLVFTAGVVMTAPAAVHAPEDTVFFNRFSVNPASVLADPAAADGGSPIMGK